MLRAFAWTWLACMVGITLYAMSVVVGVLLADHIWLLPYIGALAAGFITIFSLCTICSSK